MTQHELFQQLKTGGLHPIPVDDEIEDRESRGMHFHGNVASFIEAATALGNRCVFVASKTLNDADFTYTDVEYGFDDSSDTAKPVEIDLIAIQPKLGEYKNEVGNHCGHRIWVRVDRTTLELIVHSSWWEDMSQLREQAITILTDDRQSIQAKHEADAQLKINALIETLRGMINVPPFLKLTTQIAMQAYAVEQFPELESLGDKTLRTEIQALDAKIKARGLRARK